MPWKGLALVYLVASLHAYRLRSSAHKPSYLTKGCYFHGMSKLDELKKITTRAQLASLLSVQDSFLTYVLYNLKPANQYTRFSIPKKNGGVRQIFAPTDKLKTLQSNLSVLLLDCIDEINKSHQKKNKEYKPTLSHGFVRERSIITNAMMHLNKKNVLNIDLNNFFDSFNFGRVRGYFIKNHHFQLEPDVATVIAQIACHDNKLPQGSPCSPVITNLITHFLDISLALLAKRHSCIYTRYADDMTFSTREALFPVEIMREEDGDYIAGKKLRREIKRAGFSINEKKTRIQYRDSRQDVTGLVVNNKPNVKKDYWRAVKAQCHYLFSMGNFLEDGEVGNINQLEGRLNFIDQIDHFNRLRQKTPLNPVYSLNSHGFKTSLLWTGRERTFSQFLFYRLFYANTKPAILCEGKTDNVYLKSAVSKLVGKYPTLANAKTSSKAYELLIQFVKYSKRTRFLLELHGGVSYLNYFMCKYDKQYKFYSAARPANPVIIILDNDSGFGGNKNSGISGKLKSIKTVVVYPKTLEQDNYREADFIHVIHNLYIVLTPLDAGNHTAVEDLFDDKTRNIQVSGKSFNPSDKRDNTTEYSKEVFANKVVKANKDTIDFNGLRPLLDRIVKAVDHYSSI